MTAELLAKPNELTQPLESKYNHIITYRQSLASAAEGWPALSVAPRYDNLMLGQSPRSAAFSGAAFKPVGEAAFTPLRAVVQQKSNAAVVLDAEKVGKLAPQAQEEGESVKVGALNMARRLYLHHLGRDTDPDHLFVASNASTSGRSIAQLSKSCSARSTPPPTRACTCRRTAIAGSARCSARSTIASSSSVRAGLRSHRARPRWTAATC